MKVIDLLKPNAIALNFNTDSKEALYDKLIDLQSKAGNISDKAQYKKDLFFCQVKPHKAICAVNRPSGGTPLL